MRQNVVFTVHHAFPGGNRPKGMGTWTEAWPGLLLVTGARSKWTLFHFPIGALK